LGKYKIYFTEPKVTLTPGVWRGWLPDIVVKHMSKISILFDIIGIGVIIFPFLILSVSFFIIAMFMNSIFGSLLRFIAVINLGMSTADILLTPFMFLLPRSAAFYGGYWKIEERAK